MFHSIQIKKTQKTTSPRVCWMFLKDAVFPSCSCQSQACVGGLFVRLQELSGTEASPAPRFYVWAHMFLSNETPSALLPADRRRCFRFTSLSRQGEKKGWLWLEKRGRTSRGRFKHSSRIIESARHVRKEWREHICGVTLHLRSGLLKSAFEKKETGKCSCFRKADSVCCV